MFQMVDYEILAHPPCMNSSLNSSHAGRKVKIILHIFSIYDFWMDLSTISRDKRARGKSKF